MPGRNAWLPPNQFPLPGARHLWQDFLVSLNEVIVLAKKTVKNQITLPKAVVTRFSEVDYFDVSTDGKCIILRPLQRSRAEEVRSRLAELGIEEQDVADALAWTREEV
jgi:hypothetical protein